MFIAFGSALPWRALARYSSAMAANQRHLPRS